MACGLEIVLEAAEILARKDRKDVIFLLVGDGARREWLQQEGSRRGLVNVRFTGRLAKSLMPAVLSISDVCLIHLRKAELFKTVMPSKIFEALGMRRPVIVGVAGEATELIERAAAGIPIEPENADQLVRAVERLADNPALRARLGRAGRQYVIAHHDRDALAQDYLEVLSRIDGVDSTAPGTRVRGRTA